MELLVGNGALNNEYTKSTGMVSRLLVGLFPLLWEIGIFLVMAGGVHELRAFVH